MVHEENLKKLLLGAAAVLAVLIPAALYLANRSPAIPTGSWGLSFREPGQPPVADATAEALAQYDAKYIGDASEPVLYLTFDCGYENGNTPAILDVLKAHGAPAAFFVVGNFLRDEPELVRRMAAEGHTVGNHTWSHPDMSGVDSPEKFRQELTKVRDLYRETVGEEMAPYYRPPQGLYSRENLEMAKNMGQKTVFWSLAYVDWKQDSQMDPEEALALLNARVHNGAVVLLHNTSSTNAAILDRLLTDWEGKGYRFGTLDELFGGN